MVEAVFGLGDLEAGEMDGLVAGWSIAEQSRGIKRQARHRPQQINAVLTAFGRLMSRPAHLKIHRTPTLHLEQRHAIIIHVERLAGVNFALAPVEFADAAFAE